jgi:response regulator RpfG family c-di-GMP phosphodiesterase
MGAILLNKLSILNFLKKRLIATQILLTAAVLCISVIILMDMNYENKTRFFIEVLAILILASLCILLFNLYKHILLPLKNLYQGMAEVGITRMDVGNIERNETQLIPEVAEVNEIFLKLKHLIKLLENINNNDSFDGVLQYIYTTFSAFIPYTHIGIALLEDDGTSVRASYGISNDNPVDLARNLLGYQTSIKGGSLEKILRTGEVRVINDLKTYIGEKPVNEYNKIILDSGIKSSITLPLKINKKPIGIIFFSSNKRNVYNKEHVQLLKTLVNSISISFHKNILINDILYSSILALAKLAESRDKDTGEHLQRIKVYSGLIARLLAKNSSKYKEHIDGDFILDVEKFSPLHDIGKVSIRDDILLKPGKLTPEEFEVMKSHTIFGTKVLKEADSYINKKGKSIFKTGIEIAESHHEKWDGTGYPNGLREEKIPLSARIVALADVFDALSSSRPYKEAYSFEKTCSIILEGKGTHFDPEILDIFNEHIDEVYLTYKSLKESK